MALRRTEPQWKEFLTSAGVDDDAACTTYAQAFIANGLTETSIPLLDKDTLTELGVKIGHRMSILNLVTPSGNNAQPAARVMPVAKASVNAKLSVLTLDMTSPQFRKFLQDWSVYKNITHLQQQDFTSHLYNTCDDSVRNSPRLPHVHRGGSVRNTQNNCNLRTSFRVRGIASKCSWYSYALHQ